MTIEKEMIDVFMRWHNDNAQRFRDDSILSESRRSELPDLDKAIIEFENENVIASITIWGWGDFEVIVMCKRTKQAILAEDIKIQSPAEVPRALDGYYNVIVNQPPC